MRLSITPLSALLLCMALLAPACRSDETCTNLRKTHKETIAQQRTALLPQPDLQGPTLIISQVREETLLDPIHLALQRQGPIKRSFNSKLPARSKLSADLTLRDIAFSLSPSCTDCVQWTSKLFTKVTVRALGNTLYKGTIQGTVAGLVPVALKPSTTDASTRADVLLSNAKLTRVDLQLGDLPKSLRPTVGDLIRKQTPALLKRFGKDIEVARWDSVELPKTGIRLQVKGFQTNATTKTLRVDWVTNLKPPADRALPPLTQAPALGHTREKAAITVSPFLLTTLSQAAMRAGVVPSRLNASFKPSKKGQIYLAVRDVQPKDGGLETTFTAWNIPKSDDACYSATMRADTRFALRNTPKVTKKSAPNVTKRTIGVSLEDLKLISTDGNDTLFKLGMWVKSNILEETISAQTSVLGSMTIPLAKRSKMSLKVQRIETKSDALTIFLEPSLTLPNLTPRRSKNPILLKNVPNTKSP